MTFNPYDSLNLVSKPKNNGVAIDFVALGYSLGGAINGTHGNTKAWIDVIIKDYSPTTNYASGVDGLLLQHITLFVDTVQATWAVYSIRKGIAPTATTTYVAQFVIDETGGSGAPRIVDFIEFTINVPIAYTMDSVMPNVP